MSTSDITTQQAMRYARQIMLKGFDVDKQIQLLMSKALIIGVGGLGCSAAQFLASSGMGQLTLIDDDIVESTNLQRQILHKENSIGKKKVDSAKQSLLELNEQIVINTIDRRLSSQDLETLISQHDIILDCTDNLHSRKSINALAYRQMIPLVSGAAIRMEGQVFCVLPKQSSACYECLSYYFAEPNLSCVESGVLAPVVGIVGATQALEAIKIVTNYGEVPCNMLQIYDAMVSRWDYFNVSKRQQCAVCHSLFEPQK